MRLCGFQCASFSKLICQITFCVWSERDSNPRALLHKAILVFNVVLPFLNGDGTINHSATRPLLGCLCFTL